MKAHARERVAHELREFVTVFFFLAPFFLAFAAYRLYLEGNLGEPLLLADADVDDAELLNPRIVDGSRPAPLGEPARSRQSITAYPVQVELAIMDAQDKYEWRLAYSSMRRVLIDFRPTIRCCSTAAPAALMTWDITNP